jgi:hypothetical protein
LSRFNGNSYILFHAKALRGTAKAAKGIIDSEVFLCILWGHFLAPWRETNA